MLIKNAPQAMTEINKPNQKKGTLLASVATKIAATSGNVLDPYHRPGRFYRNSGDWQEK